MIAEEVEVYGLDLIEFDSMTKINEEKYINWANAVILYW